MLKKFITLFIIFSLCTALIPANAGGFIDKISGEDKIPGSVDVVNQEITDNAGVLYKTIQSIGIVVSLIVVVVYGVQWVVATPAKKAELKGKLWNIVIGVGLILLATTIVTFVVKAVLTGGLA